MNGKRKYKVYLVGHGTGCYAQNYYKEFVGETWATSRNQAANNMHYRLIKEGQQLPEPQIDTYGLGWVRYVLEAEEA